MNRDTTHSNYGPGKFEGESCIARFAYHQMLNGFSEYQCQCDLTDEEMEKMTEDLCTGIDHIPGPFTERDVTNCETDLGLAQDPYDNAERMCEPCLTLLQTLSSVDIHVSDQGFVHASA